MSGLPPEHPQSYHSFMWENLFRHVNIAKKNVHIPDGLSAGTFRSFAGNMKGENPLGRRH